MLRWLLRTEPLQKIAHERGAHRTTLAHRFAAPISAPRMPLRPLPRLLVLVLDGTAIDRETVLLVAHEARSNQPLVWTYAPRETAAAWAQVIARASAGRIVLAAVSDGQKGLGKSLRELMPKMLHQRCLAHVIRQAFAWLTRRPQTLAGIALRALVSHLGSVWTPREAADWTRAFLRWDDEHRDFLKERSVNPFTGRRWYTHRKVRAVRSLIRNALTDLFHYAKDSRIPRTTNLVEGGINAPLAELLHRHRGLSRTHKQFLVNAFLYGRRRRKSSTRNAT